MLARQARNPSFSPGWTCVSPAGHRLLLCGVMIGKGSQFLRLALSSGSCLSKTPSLVCLSVLLTFIRTGAQRVREERFYALEGYMVPAEIT